MNAPSQSAIQKSSEENCSLSLLSAFPRVFAPSLFVCMHAFDREKNAKTVGRGEKKEKMIHTQLPGFELALLCQLLVSRAGNLQDPFSSLNPRSEKETLLTRLQIQI